MEDVRTISLSLIRHAPTIYPKGTLPPYDPDIDLDGKDKALSGLAHALPDDAAWLVSPLSRCVKTAEAIARHGAKAKRMDIVPALEEQRYGDWHGKSVAEIWDAVKDGPKSNWHFLHSSVTPPQGESFLDLWARITPVIEQVQTAKDSHIVIIAHAMVIRAIVSKALNLSAEQALALGVEPLSLTQLTYMAAGASEDKGAGGAWSLDRLNQSFS